MNKLLINPYTVGPPVMEGSFYGRDKLLFQVSRSLRSTNVVLLQGQRRIGKTSFLKQLVNFLSQEQAEVFDLPLRVPIFFDIQRYVQDTLSQFQLHLAGTIARAVNTFNATPISIPTLVEWEADSALFQDRWLPQIYEIWGNQELVILVDEFDNFDEQISPHAMQTLVPFLRGLVSGESRLKWVFTLGRLSGKVSLEYDPIVRSGEEFRLSFFTPEEARQLIVEPAKNLFYKPEAVERIYQLTNDEPHLTQALCSKIFEHLLDEEQYTVTAEAVDIVIPQTLEAYGNAIASIVSVPPVEERVLAAVAQLSNSKKATSRNQVIDLLIDKGIRVNRDDLINAIKSLLEWELLKGNAEELQITVELIQHWLVQNRLVEPSRQENLNIQYALAQSRFEFAEKAFQAGQYELAIKDYKESLEYIPRNVKALRGLAEAYRLNDNLADRVETLRKLYMYDNNTLNEIVEALDKYAQESEKVGDFCCAIEQYEILLTIQNSQNWQQRIIKNLLHKFEQEIKELEEKFRLYKETDYEKSVIKNTMRRVNADSKYMNIKDSNEKDVRLIQTYEDDTNSYFTTTQITEFNLTESQKEELEDLELYYMRREKGAIEVVRRAETIKNNALNQLKELSLALTNTSQKITSKLEEQAFLTIDLISIKERLNFLKVKQLILSKKIQIEDAKINDDNKKIISLLLELNECNENIDKEYEELLSSTIFDEIFGSVINSFKILFLAIFLLSYILFLFWLVKDWYIKLFVALITGFLILIGLTIPFIFWVLMDGTFSLLKKSILLIMKKSKFNLLNLLKSDLNT